MIRFILLFCLCAFSFASPSYASTDDAVAVQARAIKRDNVVVFYDAQKREIARFHAVFGMGRGPKEREGDLKTPEGDYTLFPGRPSNDWEWFMPIDYPNAADVARAQRTGIPLAKLGGKVGMHTTGGGFVHGIRQSFGENWTLGCIAIASSDMNQIRALVRSPIPIRIDP